ncbi:activator of Hsp90 ATPase [Calocera viscosa TUFC12733]|uniref:Activator of Hsp90 ATPase n=1 Tax=Calocera viscosa (strain TUFC12733) TaxID=1330018 RepID=A0A167RM17_CALVF|nr:activator of Hsp90 ATPase [Calocera viscosa TUFC12733]
MSGMSTTTANWHWKNKQLNQWGAAWFERELVTVEVSEGKAKVGVSKVTDVDGDVELGRRKSKLITIYDVRVKLDWEGTADDGTEVKGSLLIPEVSHEITVDQLSEYSFQWSLSTESSSSAEAVLKLAQTKLRAALETKFAEFPIAIIDIHGKDLIVSAANSGTATPVGAEGSGATGPNLGGAAAFNPPVAQAKSTKKAKEVLNTSTVSREARFMASGDDLFELLTDERRIPTWSRAAAHYKAELGFEFSLFGGGVTGKILEVDRPKKIVSSWKLSSPTWPANHWATLTTTFDQGSDSTEVKFSLSGVPKGMESELESNLEGYYVRGLKSIGLGAIL